MDQALHQQIGRYRILGELGRGAMGVVYRATDPSIGRSVAIKTIRIRDINDTTQREKLRERLFREARSAGVLSHPNIVTIYDMDEDDGLAYIAMAFVNGPSLETILSSEEPLSGARMLRILRQAASALDYAHGKGIVHRDVKPANIMTDEDGSVKITDFGIAKITASAHATNETKTISGTPNYMSPEQVQGLSVEGRSDQFSLAVIAYEILTGERPFTGEHLSTIVYKIVTEEPPPAHRLNGTLTQRIDDVLRKALSKNPESRFPNCSNFVGALELACAESRGWKTLPAGVSAELPTVAVDMPLPLIPPGAVSPPSRTVFTAEKRPSRIIPVLMSLLVVSGLAAVFIYESGLSKGTPEPPPEPSRSATPAVKEPEPSPVAGDAIPPPSEQAPAPVADKDNPQPDTPVEKPRADKPESLSVPVGTEPFKVQRSPAVVLRAPQGRLQDIWITTNPPGAKVVLDENEGFSCLAPCQLYGAPGTHRLAASLPGYLTELRDIHIQDSALEVPTITLRQPTGTLLLSTYPAGARIRINGTLIPETTPAQLSLKPGSYSVSLEKDGVTHTETIQLGDRIVNLRVTLAR